jgi:hypothetical protein
MNEIDRLFLSLLQAGGRRFPVSLQKLEDRHFDGVLTQITQRGHRMKSINFSTKAQ